MVIMIMVIMIVKWEPLDFITYEREDMRKQTRGSMMTKSKSLMQTYNFVYLTVNGKNHSLIHKVLYKIDFSNFPQCIRIWLQVIDAY